MALTTCAFAAPTKGTPTTQPSFANIPIGYVAGFRNPSIQSSVGGQAICISGTIDVTASAKNLQINYQEPANSSEVTELCRDLPNQLNGLQAARRQREEPRYTTFSYDRLGSGLSDHPDPIQTVQAPLQLEIAHELVQLLRTGGISNHTFENVVGVGHSFGSFQVAGLLSQYPDDFDAAVLTGFSTDRSGFAVAFAGVGLTIASQSQPLRFSDLSNGYFTSAAIQGTQHFFFRESNFDPALLNIAEATKQTITVGEFMTTGALTPSPKFKGPIDVVIGENDLPNCHGNCLLPYNLAAAVKDALYPAASNGSSWYLAPGTGHGLNFHYGAHMAYEHIHDFVKKNGF
ncbi:hypothetical protein PMZ80_001913 [Knufia obscura]|uniref:AB hydrolase-1 domain-containing protein n=1 Tax=Knufia obscura TaxID=1635080 RepID=A0ABR0RVT8_9EURO|nr:hypothetical protein PMZ80_001913 [Knufia obscura]